MPLHLVAAEQFRSQWRLATGVISFQNGLAETRPAMEQKPENTLTAHPHSSVSFLQHAMHCARQTTLWKNSH
jgi:hypothetical protein